MSRAARLRCSARLRLAERYGLPVRLLELGASAGLNLRADRFCYRVSGVALGDADSPLVFDEPWQRGPVADPESAQRELRVLARAGCDGEPIDPGSEAGRLRPSYVWPDEPERLRRHQDALVVARSVPARVERAMAADWLSEALPDRPPGELVVVWQSVMRPYLTGSEREQLTEAMVEEGRKASAKAPLTWVTLEAGGDPLARFELVLRAWPDGEQELLGHSGVHGLSVARDAA